MDFLCSVRFPVCQENKLGDSCSARAWTPPRRSSHSRKGFCACVDPSPVVPSSHSGEKMCLVPDSGGSLDRGNTSRPHKPRPSDAIVCVSRWRLPLLPASWSLAAPPPSSPLSQVTACRKLLEEGPRQWVTSQHPAEMQESGRHESAASHRLWPCQGVGAGLNTPFSLFPPRPLCVFCSSRL